MSDPVPPSVDIAARLAADSHEGNQVWSAKAAKTLRRRDRVSIYRWMVTQVVVPLVVGVSGPIALVVVELLRQRAAGRATAHTEATGNTRPGRRRRGSRDRARRSRVTSPATRRP